VGELQGEPVATRLQLDAWARLDAAWYTDAVLRAATRQEPACMTLWPILIAMAKADSHAECNPTGTVVRAVEDLADAAMMDAGTVRRALELLAEGEFLECSDGRLGTVEIRLSRFEKWQNARKSKAERDLRSRSTGERSRAGKKGAQRDTDATTTRHEGDPRERGRGERQTQTMEEEGVGTTPGPATVDAPTPLLPPELTTACEQAAITGIRADWFASTINTIRQTNASAPDSIYIEAIQWLVAEANGQALSSGRAYSMLSGAVRTGLARHKERVGSTIDDSAAFWAAVGKPGDGPRMPSAEQAAMRAALPRLPRGAA
jgi:hypothetical protein